MQVNQPAKGSVFQKGGGGTNFEQAVQAAYLTGLFIGGRAPINVDNRIVEVAFQVTSREYHTDDLFVIAESNLGKHRLLMQIKHEIALTENNPIFEEVMQAFWQDYNNATLFDKTHDQLFIVKSGMTGEERAHLKVLFNWANTYATAEDFFKEVNRIKIKREKLDIIKAVLERVSEMDIPDEELWRFMKCMDILEYDYLQERSIDQANLLHLIKLARSSHTVLNEKEIYNNILALAARGNPRGGNFVLDGINVYEESRYFSPEKIVPHFMNIQKLKEDSIAILKPIKNCIGQFHLQRQAAKEAVLTLLEKKQITIVTGKPGEGKSALIKDLLENELQDVSVFAFKADQFNQPHIANVFSHQGVNQTIRDIFSCIALMPGRLIFIDSGEKLLEADPDCAFRQLMEILADMPEVKVLISSRKYAIDLISQKFTLKSSLINELELKPLSEDELEQAITIYPQLNPLLKNSQIRSLVQIPKYLDFAVEVLGKSGADFSQMDLKGFIDVLWNTLVVDQQYQKNGMPLKREQAFIGVVKKRAVNMTLYTEGNSLDPEAITLLVRDGILVKDPMQNKYAPAHDILEDWGLIRGIKELYEEVSDDEAFFRNLGKEPAIRRAFRLWIEQLLLADTRVVIGLVNETLVSDQLEKYWADEILTAVFKSDHAGIFFEKFEHRLLENEGSWLIRCLFIIRTCCKEMDTVYDRLLAVVDISVKVYQGFIAKYTTDCGLLNDKINCFFVSLVIHL
jgi:hypothetical protein